MFTRIAILLAIFVVVIASVGAGDAPISGGPGGKPFRFTCNDGSYLVGFAGRQGAWIDQIRPLCAQWSPSQQTLGKAQASSVSFGDSQGGYRFEARCPNNYLIVGMGMTFTFDGDKRVLFLDSVSLYCSSLKVPYDRQEITIGSPGEYTLGDYIHPGGRATAVRVKLRQAFGADRDCSLTRWDWSADRRRSRSTRARAADPGSSQQRSTGRSCSRNPRSEMCWAGASASPATSRAGHGRRMASA